MFVNKRNFIFPLRKRIVFESNPEMACNTFPIYKNFLNQGLNKKYKFVWLVEDKKKYKDYNIPNVIFVNYPKNILEKIQYKRYLIFSKVLIYSNRFLGKSFKNQLSIYLSHGTMIKCLGNYKIHNHCDYFLSQTSVLNTIIAEQFDVDIHKIITLGFPRVDELSKDSTCFQQMGLNKYDKVIVWMPTLRKHKGSGCVDSEVSDLGIPLIYNETQLKQINDLLCSKNILMVIKFHPAQDLTNIKFMEKSHIIFITDSFINQYGVSLYTFLGQADAYITDYSSIYYELLLTNKPIGLVIDDLNRYSMKRGIIYEDYKKNIKGYYIETTEDFQKYIEEISMGIDSWKEERIKAKEKYCDFQDFNSTERVCNFILQKINEL